MIDLMPGSFEIEPYLFVEPRLSESYRGAKCAMRGLDVPFSTCLLPSIFPS